MDTDENFALSLEYNFTLTKVAAQTKKYIQDAMDGGYMPEGVDINAVQKKIAAKGKLYDPKSIHKDYRESMELIRGKNEVITSLKKAKEKMKFRWSKDDTVEKTVSKLTGSKLAR